MSAHAGPGTLQLILEVVRHLAAIKLDTQTSHGARDAANGALDLLEDIAEDVAAMHEAIEQYKADARTMNAGRCDAEREVTRLRALLPAAMQHAEAEQRAAYEAVGEACKRSSAARVRCDALRQESTKDFDITITAPRNAARKA